MKLQPLLQSLLLTGEVSMLLATLAKAKVVQVTGQQNPTFIGTIGNFKDDRWCSTSKSFCCEVKS